ncbi:carcinoembryonic antigen-related cell adhesion molecule 5 [Ictalurus furcatus]|uniref:carcinoembryonic antigen-related cell adhesion molecule 5 n=1 Tax=Ictalurus furcatus TaxID=66913 RepID=UPI00234FC234|nr:carcinoembryonic antigen-related cell adhesion molecule 5 [Ictalurus furcatus]XP_053494173.1 carcinoembryonic antigen-related cell adhesion molecule 5 [Ictalurus furcatus]
MDLYNSWLILLLLAEAGFCSADQLVMPGEVNGVRGKSVNFTATVPTSIEVETVTWSFIPKSGASVPVYTATEVKEKVSDAYMGRVTYYRDVSTLQLNALTPADGGRYTLTIVDSNLNQLVGQTALVVLEPVADVNIVSNLPEAVEFNNTVILTCVAKGSFLVYSWQNNSIPVVVDGTHIVQNGSQLIINRVFRADLIGPISCTAKSPLESSTSDTFNLTVNYGPELVTKTQMPAADVLKKGSNLTLSCSAKSSPAAEFVWLFNGAGLPQKTATVVLSNLGEEQSGNYSCMAYNSKTMRYVSSEVTQLSVLEAISGTNISVSTSTFIAGNSTVNLTCKSSAGNADSIHWHKDGKPLDNTNRIIFSTDKSTLTIPTVQKEDAGEYKCELKNKISSGDSKYSMTINYGPENVAIKGEKYATEGQAVTINCTFASVPYPKFEWKFNDTVIPGETNACLMISSFESMRSGIYTCEASNLITGLKKTANHNLMLKDSAVQESEGLSSGAIAGIVIAVLFLLAIIIGVCIHKKKKTTDITSPY